MEYMFYLFSNNKLKYCWELEHRPDVFVDDFIFPTIHCLERKKYIFEKNSKFLDTLSKYKLHDKFKVFFVVINNLFDKALYIDVEDIIPFLDNKYKENISNTSDPEYVYNVPRKYFCFKKLRL